MSTSKFHRTRGMSLSARVGFHTGPRTPTGCREWLGARDDESYAVVKGGGLSFRVSRFLVGLPKGDARVAMHSCDNPSCVEPSHIGIGTHLDNMRDKLLKGRAQRGEAHGMSKLTSAQVVRLRARHAEGATFTALAMEMGVNRSTVARAVAGRSWGHAR